MTSCMNSRPMCARVNYDSDTCQTVSGRPLWPSFGVPGSDDDPRRGRGRQTLSRTSAYIQLPTNMSFKI